MWEEVRNNTQFQHQANEFFKTVKATHVLHYAQQVTVSYFLKYNVRGLLCLWKMGMGKTRLAAAIVNYLMRDHQAIFISAKTLHSNFNRTLEEFSQLIDSEFKPISVVALNASNMMEQVNKATLTPIEFFLDKQTKKRGSLNGKIIVIDEAHNFFNSITNGSKNATALYKAIMKSDCRLLFLTGSPIVNDPFEIAVCFNMLVGYQLFPESHKNFSKHFIGKLKNDVKIIKNPLKFTNRINGLVSYFDSSSKDANPANMPTEKPLEIVKVVMSAYQFGLYEKARKAEIESQLHSKIVNRENDLQKPRNKASYRVLSRQLCNFCYPEDEDFSTIKSFNLEILSPKFKALVKNATTMKGKGIIYSQFLKYGLGIIAKILEEKKIKFGVVTGEIPKEEVDDILKIYNSEENRYGDIMKLLLISRTGAEGLDLNCVMHIHIAEFFWYYALIAQIIGRGVRLNSHKFLPEGDRVVNSYVYVSVHGIKGNNELTTDEYLMNKSLQNQKLIGSFLHTIKEAAIDCPTHYTSCHVCKTKAGELFKRDLESDLAMKNPCVPDQQGEQFEYGGETYVKYDQDDQIHFAKLIDGKYIKVSAEFYEILLEIYQSLKK